MRRFYENKNAPYQFKLLTKNLRKLDEKEKRKRIGDGLIKYIIHISDKFQIYRLVLVAFIVEHGKRYEKEDENSIENVNGQPQILHRQGEITGAIVDRVLTRLAIGDVGRQHEDGYGATESLKMTALNCYVLTVG